MKILFTVSTYYPKKDGVQNVTQYLAEFLVKNGHKVKIITTNINEKINEEIYNGVEIKRIKLYTKYGFYIGNRKEYVKLIDTECDKCDVMINVCTQNAFTDLILKRIKKYKCKKILYLHGMFDFKFHVVDFSSIKSLVNKFWKEIRWFFYYCTNGKNFKQYDHIIQLHEKDYGNLFFKKYYNINSIIIENAASNDFFRKNTIEGFKKPFEKYLINVSNYDDRKNQKLAIEKFLKSDIDPNVGCIFIGSRKNSYYNHLIKYEKRLRKKMNLSKNEKPIKLLYNIDRKYISSYVSNAYLYLMTSKWEAFPISIVETMAAGVPYICTDIGIVKYFIGGIVCKKNDISYWIEQLVKNIQMRNELGSICRKYSDYNFKIDHNASILEKCLKDN